ncbi:MAG: hypothetical protein KBD78_15450 [Oligoflexales bacterium]|nr:hypothetical protein [Oligoflexales bacterium]
MKFYFYSAILVLNSCQAKQNNLYEANLKNQASHEYIDISSQGLIDVNKIYTKADSEVFNNVDVKISSVRMRIDGPPDVCLIFKGPRFSLESTRGAFVSTMPDSPIVLGLENCFVTDRQQLRPLLQWYKVEVISKNAQNEEKKDFSLVKLVKASNGDYVVMGILYNPEETFLGYLKTIEKSELDRSNLGFLIAKRVYEVHAWKADVFKFHKFQAVFNWNVLTTSGYGPLLTDFQKSEHEPSTRFKYCMESSESGYHFVNKDQTNACSNVKFETIDKMYIYELNSNYHSFNSDSLPKAESN